ncbi:MAG: hypothetical protein IH872_13625 [Chloroflexi bacterium]|nr:hypothetical protein [Chloroflexota bacterium]
MPKREDERLQYMSGRHPAACTCQDCTDRFLKKKKIKPQRVKLAAAEKVAKHPADCTCASCRLLGSLENLPQLDRRPVGFLKRLFGKK